MSKFISTIQYASDQEWFRYIIFNTICCLGLLGFNGFEYYQVILLYLVLFKNPEV
jgi:hypothetical protein